MKTDSGYYQTIDATIRINANRKKRVATAQKKNLTTADVLTLPRNLLENHLTAYVRNPDARKLPFSHDLLLEVSF